MYWQLVWNVLLMYGILVVVNIPAPFFGLRFENERAAQRPSTRRSGETIAKYAYRYVYSDRLKRYILRDSLGQYSFVIYLDGIPAAFR
jgi:hypothetical protein